MKNIFLFLMVPFYSFTWASQCNTTLSTSSCPKDAIAWHRRGTEFECDTFRNITYHCILNEKGLLKEACIRKEVILQGEGGCPWILEYNRQPYISRPLSSCPFDLDGCPQRDHTQYTTDLIYLYKTCLIPVDQRNASATTNKEDIPSTTKTTVKLRKMTSIIRDIENTRNQNTFENESKECSVTALIILIVFFAFACVIQLPISIYFLITSMQKMEKKRSGGTSKSENGEDDYLLERPTTADYHQSHESIASKAFHNPVDMKDSFIERDITKKINNHLENIVSGSGDGKMEPIVLLGLVRLCACVLFNVVLVCPRNRNNWTERMRRVHCVDDEKYHCLKLQNGSLAETCTRTIGIGSRACPVLDTESGTIRTELCTDNKGCPQEAYASVMVYNHLACITSDLKRYHSLQLEYPTTQENVFAIKNNSSLTQQNTAIKETTILARRTAQQNTGIMETTIVARRTLSGSDMERFNPLQTNEFNLLYIYLGIGVVVLVLFLVKLTAIVIKIKGRIKLLAMTVDKKEVAITDDIIYDDIESLTSSLRGSKRDLNRSGQRFDSDITGVLLVPCDTPVKYEEPVSTKYDWLDLVQVESNREKEAEKQYEDVGRKKSLRSDQCIQSTSDDRHNRRRRSI